MASKQEKLAAARKKLKEFQGKHREYDYSKQCNVPQILASVQVAQNSSPESVKSSPSLTPTFSDQNNTGYDNRFEVQKLDYGSKEHQVKYIDCNKGIRDTSDTYKRPPNTPTSWSDEGETVTNTNRIFSEEHISGLDNAMLVKSNSSPPSSESNLNNVLNLSPTDDSFKDFSTRNKSQDNLVVKSRSVTPELDHDKWKSGQHTDKFPFINSIPLCQNESKNNCATSVIKSNALNDVITPLQAELQNHAQTINILVQQRNEAQNALTQAQSIISEKSGEISQQKQHIISLTAVINDLNHRLSESELMVQNLSSENNAKSQEIRATSSSNQNLKSQFEAKDEECLEIRRKYEEKCKECQHLLYSLNEAQSQLSLCQIQLQNQTQPLTEEKSEMMLKLSKLENENFNLSQQMEMIRNELEASNTEKEQSSQNFKAYAQQCNSELEALHSQIRELATTNEKLKHINETVISANTPAIINQFQADDVNVEDYKQEIANLHSQINELTQNKNELHRSYEKLEEEVSISRKDIHEKKVQLESMAKVIKELQEENKKLLLEVETPNANERLLAAIESDKVAAAKAVSQNQKLKSQVVELEEAFVKLSEEKLQLTNQLSREKHLNKELQSRLERQDVCHKEADEHNHGQHHCDDHGHDHHNHDKQKKFGELEPLVNDSQEIDELKKIIRQLQDDKMELKSRLNCSNAIEMKSNGEVERIVSNDSENENEDSIDGKLRLQQMEEKVRKTMNEIAKLDEEKEKLEHLVLQLQGETETIGEYIALYQKQRMLLKQRSQEKDIQLIQLSKDKEELKSKLNSLDALVQHLLREKKEGSSFPTDAEKSTIPVSQTQETESTAVKIRALINEIGSTNLISNESAAFKHCSCCSGRLINI